MIRKPQHWSRSCSGRTPQLAGWARRSPSRAAGNPFFVEEIVRELAERGVLRGRPGAYVSTAEAAEVSVPATLQATIAARIDRLDPKAKRTLSAAAVIGSRFSLDLLTFLGVEPVVADLVAAELIDQVSFTRQPAYVFHHPLIRAVAYEAAAQVGSRRAAPAASRRDRSRDPDSVGQNAALIAEHLEAAGDLHAAFDWHMRAAAWSTNRDIARRTDSVGNAPARSPTRYPPTTRNARRCASHRAPCCAQRMSGQAAA